MRTLEDLSKLAEYNLCEKCFPVYKGVIEPNVREMQETTFNEWAGVEAYVRVMVLQRMGAYKKHIDYFKLLIEIEAPSPYIDPDVYAVFKKEYFNRFKEQINYLHREQLLGDKLWELLTEVYRLRNRVHKHGHKFTEEERTFFALCLSLIWYQFTLVEPDFDNKYRDKIINTNEKQATVYLRLLKKYNKKQGF